MSRCVAISVLADFDTKPVGKALKQISDNYFYHFVFMKFVFSFFSFPPLAFNKEMSTLLL